jgi:hypothetical protein
VADDISARGLLVANRPVLSLAAGHLALWTRPSEERSENRPDPSVTRITMKPLVPILKNIDTGESDRGLDDLQVKIFRENGRHR